LGRALIRERRESTNVGKKDATKGVMGNLVKHQTDQITTERDLGNSWLLVFGMYGMELLGDLPHVLVPLNVDLVKHLFSPLSLNIRLHLESDMAWENGEEETFLKFTCRIY